MPTTTHPVTGSRGGIAVFVVLFGLGMEGLAVLVMFLLVKLLRDGLRYRRQRLASAPVSVP
jgi:hypothetical protein